MSAPTETGARPAGPSRANGAGDGDRCRCGAGPHSTDPERCARGHVQRANALAVTTGIYAQQQPEGLREHVAALTTGITADLGGESELSTLERAYIDRLGEVEATLRLLSADIARRGLLTPSGGVRRVYDHLLAGLDRWDRLAQRLGMKRRPRQVESASDIIREYQRRDEAQP